MNVKKSSLPKSRTQPETYFQKGIEKVCKQINSTKTWRELNCEMPSGKTYNIVLFQDKNEKQLREYFQQIEYDVFRTPSGFKFGKSERCPLSTDQLFEHVKDGDKIWVIYEKKPLRIRMKAAVTASWIACPSNLHLQEKEFVASNVIHTWLIISPCDFYMESFGGFSQREAKRKANIIGAGVSGLTTALLLQRNGFQVTIFADHFPDDLSIQYTSPWAGADWRAHYETNDFFLKKYETIGFNTLWRLSEIAPKAGIKKVLNFDYMQVKPTMENDDPFYRDFLPEYKEIPKEDLPQNCDFGISYMTVTINVPKYLRWLLEEFTKSGGQTVRIHLSHINETFSEDVEVIVNCPGINAKTLGGVEDEEVFPTRGQVVIVRAPHIKSAYSYQGVNNEITYLIPREDGLVVLGGTLQPNNDDSEPDMAIAESIIKRCSELCADLCQGKGIESLEVLRHVVGLRPSRTSGIRVETEIQSNAGYKFIITAFCKRITQMFLKFIETKEGKDIVVCHNYGHHSYGYSASWGTSYGAFCLIEKALDKKSSTENTQIPYDN
ncbi:hypothetical protein G9A89_020866 [Geosiphon pyriformis]|nr:hypothetical protein G9A89_020866 [Geosiphon pyriformis]